MYQHVTSAMLLFVISIFAITMISAESVPNHGQAQFQANNTFLAWDAEQGKWLKPEEFWLNYANLRGGLTWGSSKDYPPYKQVKEFDTFMVELNGGQCLMQFFHSRWRRANDVQRWDDAFNEYSACPKVFD